MIGFGFDKLPLDKKIVCCFCIYLAGVIGILGYWQSGCNKVEPGGEQVQGPGGYLITLPETEDTLLIRLPVGSIVKLPEDTWMKIHTGGECLVRTEMSLVVSESFFEGPVVLTVITQVGYEPSGFDCELASEFISNQTDMFEHQVMDFN